MMTLPIGIQVMFCRWKKCLVGGLNLIRDISNWDTSRVESMHGMFKSSKYVGSHYSGDTSFNQDISNWDRE